MRIQLIGVGAKMPAWVTQGFQEYQKRLPANLSLQLVEIPLTSRGKHADVTRMIQKEGRLMLEAIGKQDFVVALDVLGKSWSTEQLSTQLAQWQMNGHNLSILIGGPEGLAPECLQRADQRWSLSPLTLPHPMVRILVAEQLYRAWTLLQGHPYHK
jgi:23S rRNA (pseudouridine1915-N3)-methyltransferase